MNAWFLAVLDRSVIGAYVILIVLAVRLLLRSVPKKFTCLLWFAAFLALILPVSFSSDFSFRPDLSDVTPSVVVERNAMTMAQDEAAACFARNADITRADAGRYAILHLGQRRALPAEPGCALLAAYETSPARGTPRRGRNL